VSKSKLKLHRSNAAHKRLAKKHAKKASTNVTSWIKNGYHNQVLKKQEKEKRVLNSDEKKRIYRNNEYYAFN
jgi:hypothetical protein